MEEKHLFGKKIWNITVAWIFYVVPMEISKTPLWEKSTWPTSTTSWLVKRNIPLLNWSNQRGCKQNSLWVQVFDAMFSKPWYRLVIQKIKTCLKLKSHSGNDICYSLFCDEASSTDGLHKLSDRCSKTGLKCSFKVVKI